MIRTRNKSEVTEQVSVKIKDEHLSNTWVHDGREWKLTNRVAVQLSRSGKQKILWEIQPIGIYNSTPTNSTYNRWVQPSVLFMVMSEDTQPLVAPMDGSEEEVDSDD